MTLWSGSISGFCRDLDLCLNLYTGLRSYMRAPWPGSALTVYFLLFFHCSGGRGRGAHFQFFALAVEPMAICLRGAERVVDITVGSIIEKVSLCADDALLFLEDAGPSLTTALTLIDGLGKFSVYI